MEKNKDLYLDVEENPTRKRDWFLFAIQHILAMLVACITVPLITGLPVGPTLIAAGIGTLIYIFTTKRKSPVFLSSSFAYLAPMSTALGLGVAVGDNPDNYGAVMLGMLLVGIVYVVIALVVRKTGTGWLNKLLPPVVIGPIIMVIGLSLAASAIANVTGGTYGMNLTAEPKWYFAFVSICIALLACFLTSFFATSKKKNLTLIPFVLGMVGTYLVAVILTIIGNCADVDALKVINFDIFTNNEWGSVNGWITTDFMFVNVFKQKASFNMEVVGQVCLAFIPVSLVTVCEHIGDHKNLGNIINRDLLGGEPGLTRTLIGDGVATAVSGVFCGAANTTYGENVAVIGVSKVASVNVIILASLMTIVFGFFKPFSLVLETVPACITGGVSLVLYGFIASSGIKMLIKERVDFSVTKNIIVASVILVTGIGGLALGFGGFVGAYTVSISGTAIAMVLGIIMNIVLKDHSTEIQEQSEIGTSLNSIEKESNDDKEDNVQNIEIVENKEIQEKKEDTKEE